MKALDIIEQHLGGRFIDDEMRKADNFLGRVGWLMHWTSKRRVIWYECCGHTLEMAEENTPEEEQALYHAAHRKKGTCPYCSSAVYYINRRFARQNDYTEVYTVHYRMSRAEPNTLLVLGMWSGRRWYQVKMRREPQEIQTEHEPCSLVVLPWGDKPKRFVRETLKGPGSYDSWWWGTRAQEGSGGWVQRESVQGGDTQSITGCGIEYLICDDLAETVRGTRWEKPVRYVKRRRSGIPWSRDLVTPLKTFCTHTAMEYMLGNGMEGIVKSCLRGDGTLSLIRWKRKKPAEMLGLDSNELARLRRMEPEKVSGYGLMALRIAQELGQRIKTEDAMKAAGDPVIQGQHASVLKGLLRQYGGRWGVLRILRYLSKSYSHPNLWRDYMQELQTLGEANDESRVFPRDLHEAHGETSIRIRYKEDAETQQKLESRAETLDQQMHFEACGLVLEPFRTAAEIIAEGKIQSICIGSYVKTYADGNTILLKLRRTDAPDVPFHAVEMRKDGKTLVQCRGYKNRTFAQDEKLIRDFWAEWDRTHGTHTPVHITIDHSREAKTA